MLKRLLFFAVLLLVSNTKSFSQLVGGNAYLQGQWLEIGELPNGAFGAPSPPAGYHPYPLGSQLAETYDLGHDGWGVGVPPYNGDYTIPGSPFEGWELQVNGVRGQAFCCGGYTGGLLAGSVTSYTNFGQSARSYWAGTGGGLNISQETRVDTYASWVTVTTTFVNPTGSAINGVYYLRSCDPDNDQAHGGPFSTNNMVIYQNDLDHRVCVTAVGLTYHDTLSLATKDCRAVGFIYNSWSIGFGVDLATCWNKTYAPAQYTVGIPDPGDIAIGLVYNIGTINAGDKAIISYAYLFNHPTLGVDSAFPDPLLTINGSTITTFPDTFDACAFPKLDSVPLDILFGTDKDWSWSTWTWSPGTGLSATTGVSIFADLTSIPGSVTYTVTGVDSNANAYTCNMKTFIFTIKSCHAAWSTDPCYGGEILLGMHGDSLGATYKWTGPGGFTSTLHDPIIKPALYTDSGLYRVIKTIGGINDTDSTYVTVYSKPTVILSDNGPLCTGLLTDTLLLHVLPVSAGESFAWTGPNSFTSSIANPVLPGFISVDTGTYTLIATSSHGCIDTNSIKVGMVNPPAPPPISGIPVYCYGSPFIPLSVTGGGVLWYYPTSTSPGVSTPPTVNTSVPGTYTFWATQTIGCISPQDSFTVVVKPQIFPGFTWNTILGCDADIVTFNNTSTQSLTYLWDFGDGTGSSDSLPAPHSYTSHDTFRVMLTASTPGCSSSIVGLVNTTHSVKALFQPTPDTFCAGVMTILADSFTTFVDNSYATEPAAAGGSPSIGNLTGKAGVVNIGIDTVPNVSYSWNFGDGGTSVAQNPPTHSYAAGGTYHVTLMVTDSIGCQDTTSHNVYVLQYGLKLTHDTMLCISQPLPLRNEVLHLPSSATPSLTDYTYHWTPANNIDDTSAKVPNYSGFSLTTYTFTVTENTYGCFTTDTMRIHSVLGVVLSHVSADATVMYGNSYQLNADSEVYYLWQPDDGSLSDPNINDPIATPTKTTTYTVIGFDRNGCKDSAYVNVIVDSTMHEDIPTGFTPNGDGLNDVFRPVGLKFQRLVEFRIYNRWGQQVFFSNDIRNGWDGTFNGVPQDIDVYYYVIIVARPGGEGDNLVYKGEVTLIR